MEAPKIRTRDLVRVACIGIGLQFGWAIQLSLLTPYVQELGVPHTFSSYIWLCGPISGFLVQPTVGYFSDKCRSRFGRRRPFIFAGFLAILMAALLIGFSADIGHLVGDDIDSKTKTRAIVFFVCGFWLLDLANNTLQGPVRALLADLAGTSQKWTRRALAYFTVFLGIGNVLGYGAGTFSHWHKILPFTKTKACNNACSNLKSTFLIAIILLIITTILSLTAIKEAPLDERKKYTEQEKHIELISQASNQAGASDSKVEVKGDEKRSKPFFIELFQYARTMSRQMWFVMAVTAITWVAWFPFLLYDTDWTGKDVYRGQPNSKDQHLADRYDTGVRIGAFGLILNSIVLTGTSLVVEPLCRHLGPRNLWASMNFLLGLCFCALVGITKAAHSSPGSPSPGIIAGIMVVFAVIGAPQAICWNLPYSLMASHTRTSGGGQGFSMGILNLAVVVPQMIISFALGPFDQLFGGGNVPSFVVGIVASVLSAVIAFFVKNPPKAPKLPQTHAEVEAEDIQRS